MFEFLMQPVGVLAVNVNTDSIGDWAGTEDFYPQAPPPPPKFSALGGEVALITSNTPATAPEFGFPDIPPPPPK